MQIQVVSEHFRIDSGDLGLLYLQAYQSEPANIPPGEDEGSFIWARCISANLFEAEIGCDGSYDVIFGHCTLTHLPSGQNSKALSVKRFTVKVTGDDIASGKLTVPIPNALLFRIVLLRNGVGEPQARVMLAQDPNTLDVRTDETGALTLFDDPRELLAVAFDRGLKASICCWDAAGRHTLLASTDAFPAPLE